MNTTPHPRSSFVTTTAWLFIALGGFAAFIGLIQNIALHSVFPLDQMRAEMSTSPQFEELPSVVKTVLFNMEWVFGLVFLMSLLMLVSAIGLLRRRNWARLVFIGFMLFSAITNLATAFAPQFLGSAFPIQADVPPEFQAEFESMIRAFTVIFVVMGVGFSALFVWIAWRLRAPAIVAEFRSAESADTAGPL